MYLGPVGVIPADGEIVDPDGLEPSSQRGRWRLALDVYGIFDEGF
jgi:hypothetical protein